VLPPMPWPWIGQLTDSDLKDLFAYLQSLPPVKNRVPAPVDPTERQ
jgi:cytochrome c553